MAEAKKIIRRNAQKDGCVVPEYRKELPGAWTDKLEKAFEFPESQAGAIVAWLTRQKVPLGGYVTDKETERKLLAAAA